MNFLGMDIVWSPTIEPGQMMVRSGNIIYGWDLAKDGGDTCVTARVLPNGDLEIIDVTHGQDPAAAPCASPEKK